MNAAMTRGLMALSTFAWLATGAAADELKFTELEQRLSTIESKLSQQDGVQTASYLNGGDIVLTGCGCDSGCNASCGCEGCCGDNFCCCACPRTGGWYGEAELLFLRYHRADGVRAGAFNTIPPATTDDVEFDFETAPRFTLGYIGANGVGARVRYFEYDHPGDAVFADSGVEMGVDTFNLDFELFDRLQLGSCWLIEYSGGIRYNDFREDMLDPVPPATRFNEFNGIGGIVGLEVVRKINSWAAVYGRARGAILMDDKHVENNNPTAADTQQAILRDVTLSQFELAIGGQVGYDSRYCRTVLRAGLEWQQWSNFSTSFTPLSTGQVGGNPPAHFAGPSDVGFAGFTVGVIVSR